MRKAVLMVLIVLLAATAFVYLLIPNIVSFSRVATVGASRDGLSRKLFNEQNWSSWWPGTVNQSNTVVENFHHHNSAFAVDKKTTSSIDIYVEQDEVKATTSLNIINKNFDTTQLIWTGAIATSYNPIKRIKVFLASRAMIRDIDTVLNRMQSYYSETGHVYDYNIREVPVKDSMLVSTYAISRGYPSVAFIYQLIDQLHQHVARYEAKEMGYPMLNVSTMDSTSFLTRVAIPVNKSLPSSGNIAAKQMPFGGNILVADVKGGTWSVRNALQQVENYIVDHHRSAPAIPFLSMITDRRQEPDTSKWLTRIYYPVM